MECVKNEKPVMVDPSAGYDLHQAVIDTNAAVQKLADLMSQAVSMRIEKREGDAK